MMTEAEKWVASEVLRLIQDARDTFVQARHGNPVTAPEHFNRAQALLSRAISGIQALTQEEPKP